MNTRYKFEALYRDGNTDIFADPYAEVYEVAPGNASVLAKLEYSWSDSSYMKKRGSVPAPVNIYEVHMPTWKRNSDGNPLNYLEFGKEAAMYVKNMGYNYIQFMPLMEYRDTMAGVMIPWECSLRHRDLEHLRSSWLWSDLSTARE